MSSSRIAIGVTLLGVLFIPALNVNYQQAMDVAGFPLLGEKEILAFESLLHVLLGLALGWIVLSNWATVLRQPKPDEASESDYPDSYWLKGLFAGIVLLLSISVGLVVLVNPRGYYPTAVFPSRLELLRPVKDAAVSALSHMPAIVIMGSSHSLSLSPSYLREITGYSTFNWSVEAATPADYHLQLDFMLANDHGDKPDVLFAEVFEPLIESEFVIATRTSWRMFPNLSPRMMALYFWHRVQGVFEGSHLAESLYMLRYSRVHGGFPKRIQYDPSGQAISPVWGLGSAELREQRIQADIATRPAGAAFACNSLTPDGKSGIEGLAVKAANEGISVVFFSSPRHPELVEAVSSLPHYESCHRSLVHFMEGLERTYEGVRYLDFTDISTFGGSPDEFADSHHVSVENGFRMLNAATPVLVEAVGEPSSKAE